MGLRCALLLCIWASVFVQVGKAILQAQWVPCPITTYAYARNESSSLRDIAWALHTRQSPLQPLGSFPKFHLPKHTLIECALIAAPLDYEHPDAGSVELFVKRLRMAGKKPEHALWLLSGGPGDGSADDVEPLHAILFDRLSSTLPGSYEIFVTDHRGVGRSSRLGCPRSQAETPGSLGGIGIVFEESHDCLLDLAMAYPNGKSRYFSAEGAARDLHFLAEGMRLPGQTINVYGISYGTYWAGVYLRTFPHHARVAVLDGVVSASGVSFHQRLTFDTWDRKMNDVGHILMQKCSADSFCSQKLGAQAGQLLSHVFDSISAGHCAQSVLLLGGLKGLKKILGSLLYGWAARGTITALIYRLARCSKKDVGALAHFAAAKEQLSTMFPILHSGVESVGGTPLRSEMLFRNVMLSELWDPVSVAEMQRRFNDSTFGMDIFQDMPSLYKQWPLYKPGAYFNTSLNTSSQLLFMNGDTDCQTPIWSAQWEFKSAVSSAGKHFISWDGATHFSILNTPVPDDAEDPCGLQAVVAFLREPTSESWRQLPCRTNLKPINFEGVPIDNFKLWGTSDAYEDRDLEGQNSFYV